MFAIPVLFQLAAQPSAFRKTLGFFDRIGIYDVVLPFLLIFTLVYAILEKTKILGVEKVEGKEYTRKNLNSMAAFVIAFLFIASTELVRIMNEFIANILLLVLIGFSFLLTVGIFYKEGELDIGDKWRKFFLVVSFIAIIFIFLGVVGWLPMLWAYLSFNIDSTLVSSILLLLFVVLIMWWLTSSPSSKKEKKEDED